MPGKFDVSLDGVQMPGKFDTEHEAMMFTEGLIMGNAGILKKLLDKSVRVAKVEFNSPHL